MKKNISITIFAVFLIAACNRATNPNQTPIILNIRAYIDGRSQLIIKGDMFIWRHYDFDAPGRWELGEGSQPTYLNKAPWYPDWPDFPDSTNDSCNCYSSSFKGIPYLARTNQRVWIDIVQIRGGVRVIQQPNADNDYTFVLELDDYFDGADWYEVNLNYIVGALH